MINNNKAGFVFENGDDVALCEAANRLLESHEQRTLCGANSRMLLERYFSVESAVSKIINEVEKRGASCVY